MKSYLVIKADDFVVDLVYVVLGPYHEHIGLLTAMEDRRLFDRGNGYLSPFGSSNQDQFGRCDGGVTTAD